jgi:hypothetical protein
VFLVKKATCFYLSLTTATLLLVVAPFNARAAAGDLYEADFGSGTIFKFTPNATVTVFASGLVNPSGLAFDASANLFVADFGSGMIFRFTPDGTRSTFASGLNKPFGLAFDASGNLFEGDRSGTIFKFSPSGTKTTFATGLNIPAGLAFDSSGNLFETDFGSGNIFEFTSVGAQSTFASGLISPDAITIDGNGNVFVSGGGGNVFKFTPAGVKSIYASGFSQPTGVAFDVAANLFVSDNATGTISKVAPDGTKTTFATGLRNPQNLVFQPATDVPLNISTRLEVQTGEHVLIGGFIVTGTDPKRVIIRGIGPSLADVGVQGALADPILELHQPDGTVITNDNWKINDQTQQSQEAEIRATTIPPKDDLESALVATLAPGAYTVILAGKNQTTGIGVVEVYDLAQSANSKLANISSRGFVASGDNVMIGGFIVGAGNGGAKVIVRAIGPSLTQSGVSSALPDPTLELHDGNGVQIGSNDNWKENRQAIEATGLPPSNDFESALVAILPSGAYTAIVAGKGGNSGVALVEVYNLR